LEERKASGYTLGFISNYSTKSGIHQDRYLGVGSTPRTVQRAVDEGRSKWREIFQNKEDSNQERRNAPKPFPGGSFVRSSLSTAASTARLVEALRSRAPGGWS
jgi:hypothetical protein